MYPQVKFLAVNIRTGGQDTEEVVLPLYYRNRHSRTKLRCVIETQVDPLAMDEEGI